MTTKSLDERAAGLILLMKQEGDVKVENHRIDGITVIWQDTWFGRGRTLVDAVLRLFAHRRQASFA